MRELDVAQVTEAVAKLAVDACTFLGDDVVAFFEEAIDREQSETGRDILVQLLENANLARDAQRPLCQDTGLAVVFLEIGQDVHLVGIEAQDVVNFSQQCTPAVEAAIPHAVDEVVRLLETLRGGPRT